MQIRYAALDAHCLIRIYRRCQEWTKALGLDFSPLDLIAPNYMCASLPLFWDKPLPAELLNELNAMGTSSTTMPAADTSAEWGGKEEEDAENDGWGDGD
jgi:hypothetical protein